MLLPMLPKRDTVTTDSISMVPEKILSAPPVSFVTTGGNQIFISNFGTMLPNFGTGFI